MRDRLILNLHNFHFGHQTISKLFDLMRLQHVFFPGAHLVLHLLHLLDGLILRLNVFLDLSQIFGYFAIILLISIILRLWDGLGGSQNILHRVRDDEILVRFQSHNWLIVFGDHRWFSVHFLLLTGGDGSWAFDLFSDTGASHGASELFLVVRGLWLVLAFEFSHGLVVAFVGVGSHEVGSVTSEI